jgi:hypothetical protein
MPPRRSSGKDPAPPAAAKKKQKEPAPPPPEYDPELAVVFDPESVAERTAVVVQCVTFLVFKCKDAGGQAAVEEALGRVALDPEAQAANDRGLDAQLEKMEAASGCVLGLASFKHLLVFDREQQEKRTTAAIAAGGEALTLVRTKWWEEAPGSDYSMDDTCSLLLRCLHVGEPLLNPSRLQHADDALADLMIACAAYEVQLMRKKQLYGLIKEHVLSVKDSLPGAHYLDLAKPVLGWLGSCSLEFGGFRILTPLFFNSRAQKGRAWLLEPDAPTVVALRRLALEFTPIFIGNNVFSALITARVAHLLPIKRKHERDEACGVVYTFMTRVMVLNRNHIFASIMDKWRLFAIWRLQRGKDAAKSLLIRWKMSLEEVPLRVGWHELWDYGNRPDDWRSKYKEQLETNQRNKEALAVAKSIPVL